MTKKEVILGIIIILMITTTIADECGGSISIVELPDLYPGDNPSVISYTSIPSSLGSRNWDVWVMCPRGNRVALLYTQLSDDDYTMAVKWPITDNYLNGVYVIHAKITVLNSSNLSEVMCEESITREVSIHTNRTSYNDLDVRLEIFPEYKVWNYYRKRNLTIGDMTIPITVSMSNIPLISNVVTEDINITLTENPTINISPAIPFWTYEDFRNNLKAVEEQEKVIEHLSGEHFKRLNEIQQELGQLSSDRVSSLENKTEELIQERAKLWRERDNAIAGMNQCLATEKQPTVTGNGWDFDFSMPNLWVMYAFGILTTILGFRHYARKKVGERAT